MNHKILFLIISVILASTVLAVIPTGGVFNFPFSQNNANNILDEWNGFNATNNGTTSTTTVPTYNTSGNGLPFARKFGLLATQSINVTNNGRFNLSDRNVSVSMWVNVNTSLTGMILWSNWIGTNDGMRARILNTGILQFETMRGGSLQDTVLVVNFTALRNTWQHLVFVRNGTNQLLVYRNGILNASGTFTNGIQKNNTNTFIIGDQSTTPSIPFNGTIDDVMLFNTTLTPGDVSQLYNTGNLNPASSINITAFAPANQTQFNAQAFTINITADSASTYNITLFMNGVVNQSVNNTPAGTGRFTQFNFSFASVQDQQYNWTVNLTNSLDSITSGVNTFYIDNVLPVINPTTFPRADNTSVFYKNFTTSFNVTDNNLFSWEFNLTTLAGTTLVNYSNYTLSGLTSLNIRQFIDLTNYAGPLRGVLRVSDGHTKQDITFKNVAKINNELSFDNVKVYLEDKTDTIALGYLKQKDRYTFEFNTSLAETRKEFIVESDQYIHILENSGYKAHLVSGDKWIDFEEDGIQTATVERITGNKVRVIVNSAAPKNKYKFKSIGQLNTVTQTFSFFSTNATDAHTTPILAGNTNTFYLNVTYNTSYQASTPTAILFFNGNTYTVNPTTSSGLASFSKDIVMPNLDTNATSYWNFTIGGQTYQTGIRTSNIITPRIDNCDAFPTRFVNYSIKDEITRNLVNLTVTSMSYAFTYTSGNYSGVYSGNESNANVYNFCMYPSTANFTTDVLIQYASNGYTTRDYVAQDFIVDNTEEAIDLFLLNTGNSSAITIKTVDPSDNPLQNILVEAYRYYISNDSYSLVESGLTGPDGNRVFNLQPNTVYYKFKFYQNGVLIEETIKFPIILTAYTFTLGTTTTSPLLEYYQVNNGIIRNIGYNNGTHLTNLSYTTNLAGISQFCFNITDQNQTYSSQCSSLMTNTLNYTITRMNVSYTAFGYVILNNGNVYIIATRGIDTRDGGWVARLGQTESLLLSMVILIFISTLFIFDPTIAIVGEILGSAILFYLGLLLIPWPALVGFWVIGAIIIVVINLR